MLFQVNFYKLLFQVTSEVIWQTISALITSGFHTIIAGFQTHKLIWQGNRILGLPAEHFIISDWQTLVSKDKIQRIIKSDAMKYPKKERNKLQTCLIENSIISVMLQCYKCYVTMYEI